MMRLSLGLYLAIVVVAVSSVKALPTGAKGKDPGSGVGDSTLLVEEVINHRVKLQTTEDVIQEAGESGFETQDMPEEGVQSEREVWDHEEVEPVIKRDGEENQESDQDSKEGSETAESKAVVVESDSSEESSNEEETVTFSEATDDQDSQDEVPVDVLKKSKGRILENSRAPAKSKNKPILKENEDSKDSPLEKRDIDVLLECSTEEENDEVLVQVEPLDDDINKDSETSDLEIAQSDINEIIFGEEEESVEEVDSQEGSHFSDSATDDTHSEEVNSEEVSTDHQTRESLVRKRTASVENSSEDGEAVFTDGPRILSPAEFFGYFEENESDPVIDEDE